MALSLTVKCLENLSGKFDRVIKSTFREHTYTSKIVHAAKHAAYFGETFQWPIARLLEERETLRITVYNRNKYFNNKSIGSFEVILQQVITDGVVNITEPLVDSQNRISDVVITFEIKYYSPDGKVGSWGEDEFNNPLIEQYGDTRTMSAGGDSRETMYTDDDTLDDSMSIFSDHKSLLSASGLRMPGEDNAAQQAMLDSMINDPSLGSYEPRTRGLKRPEIMALEMHRPRDFQVAITILECQQLNGLNIDPVVKVECGDDTQYTSIKQATNCPYYNEYFVFDYHETPAIFFDKTITLTVLHASNIPGRSVWKAGKLLAGTVIGYFRCDLSTVYAASEHTFCHKWAVLIDPKDIGEGPKGYVKCDLSVMGKGDNVKPKKPDKDENNIEANLLLPSGVPMERQRAHYQVVIHRAEDVPRMDSGLMASVKKAISLTTTAFVDAYVEVSFVGLKGKTSVKKSYHPEWKEALTFVDHFPPLCNRIKIQLKDEDALSDDAIATHFIELSQIMDPGGDNEGMLPSFGPSWINFYGAPRNYKLEKQLDEMNEGVGEGAAYRGRLLLAFSCKPIEGEAIGPSKVRRDKFKESGRTEVAIRKEFLLYASFFDISMIDKEYKNKQIYFEISIGTYGNTMDAKGGKMFLQDSDSGDDSEVDENDEAARLIKHRGEEEALPISSTTEPTEIRTDDDTYYYIPTDQEKPCLYICARLDDLRKRLYHENLLDKMAQRFDDGLEEVRQMIRQEENAPHIRFRQLITDFIKGCDIYIRLSMNLGGKTKLDKHRLKMCKTHVEKMKFSAKKMLKETFQTNLKQKFREAKRFLFRLRHISKEPQHALPDVFIWMVCDKKRVAYHRIPSREILHATQSDMQGKNCGKLQTIFLRKPGRRSAGAAGWSVQAKLHLYLWLGLHDARKTMSELLKALPTGYEETEEVQNAFVLPPSKLIYREQQTFQLRAYIYQARSLIGSDATGLSDPFARVIINNQCQVTTIVDESLSPTWNQTIVIDNVKLTGTPQEILDNPPVIMVEIYDYDTVGQPEFLGRAIVTPDVKLNHVLYEEPDWPAPLQWWDVLRGPKEAGELLAAFELIEDGGVDIPVLPEKEKLKKDMIVPLPPAIKPILTKFRIEVVFWGVREMRRVQLTTVDHPRVEVECGGQMVSSKPLLNMARSLNFEDNFTFLEVMLPDNVMFWPPLTIICVDCRNFGREVMVGTHTIRHIQKYIYVSPEEKKLKQIEDAKKRAEELDKLKRLREEFDATGAISPETAQRILDPEGKLTEEYNQNVLPPQTPTTPQSSTSKSRISLKSSQTSVSNNNRNSVFNFQNPQMVDGTRTPHGSQTPRSTLSGHGSSKPLPNGRTSSMSQYYDNVSMAPSQKSGKTALIKANGSVSNGAEHVVIEMDTTTAETTTAETQQIKPAALVPAETSELSAKKKRRRRREMIADLDWWSKYYASLEDDDEDDDEYADVFRALAKTCQNLSERVFQKVDEEDSKSLGPSSGADLMDMYMTVNYEAMDMSNIRKMATNIDEEEDDLIGPNKKKRKKRKKKKKKKKRLKRFKGAINNAFSTEEDAVEVNTEDDTQQEDEEMKKITAKIKMYNCELEQVREFGGFKDWAHTFDLMRGKKDEDDDDDYSRIAGKFKGMFTIYKEEEAVRDMTSEERCIIPRLKRMLPDNRPIEVNVKIYIVKISDIHPMDLNGKADPYIILKLGKKEKNDKEHKQFNTLNPTIGKMFEFDATFPMESLLHIQVMDYDTLSADDLVGETVIDLESRYYSVHRGTCGLPHNYETYGYNTWRDNMRPTQILNRLCQKAKMNTPTYDNRGHVTVEGVTFAASPNVENEHGELKPSQEPAALAALKQFDIVPGGCELVPEHLESRALYSNERPGMEQGRIDMWIDLLPCDYPSASVTNDISPRKPKQYELRVIIWNTDDVILDDVNPLTGEASSDVFVKGFLKGKGVDGQETDVHYRSLTGEGNFNYRFVFPFDYLKAEEKIIMKQKESIFSLEQTETKVPSKLTLQVWDADLVSADDFLGQCVLDLNRVPRPCKTTKTCTLTVMKKGWPTFNLFKQKKIRGWWPMEGHPEEREEGEEKVDENRPVGKVEAEIQLLTEEEADKSPAGLGREAPEQLPEPNRPDSSFLWFMNPLKTLKYIIWKNWKWTILKILIIIFLIAFLILFFYSVPGVTVQKVFGT